MIRSGDQEAILREIEVFLTGALPVPDADRVLATLMITGIVGAAATAVRLGDEAWGEIVDLGLAVRVGLYAGECETAVRELSGVALQIAERVFDRAGPGEVVVSSTVKDLVAGSGIEFEEVEARLLTGPASGWRLHRVMHGPRLAHDLPAAVLLEVAARPPTALNRREREVVILVARGMSNRQVAGALSISPATVKRHMANVLGKLGFHSRLQVAAWAVAHDLLRSELG